jgi:uncharacterized membrane protein YvlD (DUF360 family)
MLRHMAILMIKLGIRLAVFALVFWLIARKRQQVVIKPRWATPIVATVFALLNTVLYWALKPILNLATLGVIGFAMPLVINAILLGVTVRVVEKKEWLKIDGFFATIKMAALLTLAHGALWFALDYLPPRLA